MKIIGLDGKIYKWKPELYHHESETSSTPHKKARELLKKMFPFYSLNEEVPILGTQTRLYLDIYIHSLRMAVEVQGIQHYQYSHFFHGSNANFKKAKQRDQMKRDWCTLNNIDLVELPDGESLVMWESRIRNRGT